MRYLLLLVGLLFAMPLQAQETGIITTVNGIDITADEFQARYTLEGYLLVREITVFAEIVHQTTPDPQTLNQTLELAFAAQFNAFDNPVDFADTILNGMEIDIMLSELAAEQGITITEDEIDIQVIRHVTATSPTILAAEGTIVPDGETFESEIEAFYEEAETFTGATREEIRTLFAGRALRTLFFEQVTADLSQVEPEALTRAFQVWVLEQRAETDITRRENWQDDIPTEPDFREAVETAIAEVIVR